MNNKGYIFDFMNNILYFTFIIIIIPIDIFLIYIGKPVLGIILLLMNIPYILKYIIDHP